MESQRSGLFKEANISHEDEVMMVKDIILILMGYHLTVNQMDEILTKTMEEIRNAQLGINLQL